jgi:DNA ligase-1
MILPNLRANSSRIVKEQILDHASELDKLMFQYAYHPINTYGVKFDNIDYSTVQNPTKEMFDILDELADRTLTGNEARETVEAFAFEDGDLIKLICNRDLDCGVTATTLNKVFGKGFIKQFKVQLAKEVTLDKVKFPCIAQIKYDGVRVIAIIKSHKNKVIFKTRNGKVFEYPALEKALLSCKLPDLDIILDGELTLGTSSASNHTNVSGAVTSSMRGNPIPGANFVFNVFDFMSIGDFYSQTNDNIYGTRFAAAKTIVDNIQSDLVRIAETHNIATADEANKMFNEVYKQGYEGLILKHWHHLYTFKRSADWVKMKAIKDCDLKCVDIKEGTGKYQHQIGSLICEGMVEGKFVIVDVGSGLTDMQRETAWDCFVGETIEIKYNELIKDSITGDWSLFLPRFVTIRMDK